MPEVTPSDPAEKICRLCLVKTVKYSSLLEEQTSSMLQSLTSIKVNCNDHISTAMCEKCSANLKIAYEIQQYMIQSDKKLKDLHFSSQKIKEEVVTTDAESAKNDVLWNTIEKELVQGNKIEGEESEHEHLTVDCDLPEDGWDDSDDENLLQKSLLLKKIKTGTGPQRKTRKRKSEHFCSICSLTLPTATKLAYHKRDHIRKTKTECPVCHKKINMGYLKVHLVLHSGTGPMCEFCGKRFSTEFALKDHIVLIHEGILPKCDECGKSFKKKAYRDVHVRREHSGVPVDVCSLCGKKFYASGVLTKHMNRVHLGLSACKCELCGKEYKQSSNLKKHMRRHNNDRPYKCEICGDGFTQNTILRQHKRLKHKIKEADDVKCKICGKGFMSEHAVNTHMHIHV